ncbi:hypothetical protein MLD38_010057 [Melastoma candidum]|uniref:Uncharacterized protein n=1 Tax=Melastoma candidum TaxID=119954 RepID=A0ACB9R0E9_9MYRT|nr:hypothetical protein MLD38_010057 [Melastoma candidum]
MQIVPIDSPTCPSKLVEAEERKAVMRLAMCPSCSHCFDVQDEGVISSLHMGMKFDPNDRDTRASGGKVYGGRGSPSSPHQ